MKQFLVSLLAISIFPQVSAQANLPQRSDFYYEDGQMTLERMLNLTPNTNNAKNVIIFVSGGAEPAIVTATRIFDGQLRGENGEENYLSFEAFPYVAATKTYNTNAQTPDSAGTSTAMQAGVKTKQGVLGVNSNVLRGECETQFGNEVISLAAMAESVGMATGVISTARITHATPAAAYAHSVDRNWEDNDDLPEDAVALGCKDIASQLIEFPYGDGIDVAMGGGRRHFLPAETNDPEDEGAVGNRTDGRDLTQEWVDAREGATYVFDQAGFDSIDASTTGPVLGLFERSHMEYEYDRAEDTAGEPSLAEMTATAIEILSRNEEGFYLQVEAGRVDHAAQAGNAYRMLTDNIAFDEAVQTTLDMVNLEETLIIVTADHAHTVTLAGYAQRGNPILGLVRGLDAQGLPVDEATLAADEKPYTSIAFINGPGAIVGERPAPTEEEAQNPEYRQQALIPLSSETNGATDVLAYATGPMAYLVGGVVEQSYFYHVMAHALDLENRLADADIDIAAMLPQPNQTENTGMATSDEEETRALSQENTGMAVAQVDSEQVDSEQVDSEQTEGQQEDSASSQENTGMAVAQVDSEQVDSEQTEGQQEDSASSQENTGMAVAQVDSEQVDSEQTEGQQEDSASSQENTGMAVAQVDSEQVDSEQTEGQQTEGQQTESGQTTEEPDLEMTIRALEGGVGNIPLADAIQLVQSWRTRLSSLEDTDLTPTIDALDNLAAALGEENLDAARDAMMSLSEDTANLAEANDNAMLQRLAELLSSAASN